MWYPLYTTEVLSGSAITASPPTTGGGFGSVISVHAFTLIALIFTLFFMI